MGVFESLKKLARIGKDKKGDKKGDKKEQSRENPPLPTGMSEAHLNSVVLDYG